MSKPKAIYRCVNCGKIIKPKNGYLECCGVKEKVKDCDIANREYAARQRILGRNIRESLRVPDSVIDGLEHELNRDPLDDDYED